MKLKEFQNYLKEKDIDYALFFNFESNKDNSFTYFTDLKEINAILVINKETAFILVSPLELDTARKTSRIRKIHPIEKDPFKQIKSKVRGKKVALNFDSLTVSIFRDIKRNLKASFIDVSSKIKDLRLTKTSEEIKRLKKAASIASSIMKKAISKASSKMTEIQLKDFIEHEIKKCNVIPSFPTIVAASKNASTPHHVPTSAKLRGFVVIDMGVIYKNYCSDITRTFYIGKPAKKEIEDYNLVLNTQKECISKIKKNIKLSDLHKHAAKKLGKDFMHSLGHGIGLDVHERPRVSMKSGDKVIEGMVFAVEPGIYRRYHGIRIEDDILFKDAPIPLTKVGKDLKVKS